MFCIYYFWFRLDEFSDSAIHTCMNSNQENKKQNKEKHVIMLKKYKNKTYE